MKNKLLKTAAVLGLAAMLTGTLGVPAKAVDLKADCSLSIELSQNALDEDDAPDVAEITYDLYQVADLLPQDGFDAFAFAPAEGLKLSHDISDYSVLQQIADGTTTWDWNDVAAEIASQVLTEDYAGEPVSVAASTQDGTAKFEGLLPGLYLLVPRGTDMAMADYVVPGEEEGDVLTTIANSDHYTYAFRPQLISLPTKSDADGDSRITSAASDGDWDYNPTINLKYTFTERYGNVRIIKDLQSYNNASPATFVFRVTATLKDETVYSNVFARTFTAVGTQEILIEEKIPIGAQITVEELANTAYDADSNTKTITLEGTAAAADGEAAIPTVEVTFTNDYNDSLIFGYGIENSFTYTNGQWSWARDGQTVNQ